MTARGRPKKKDAKRGQYRLRMGDEDEKMLDYICQKTGESKAEVLRKAIQTRYNLERTREYRDTR